MNKSPLQLLVTILCLLCAQLSPAQSPDLVNEDRDMVRVMRHPDGSKAVYKRQAGWRGMRCATYSPSGRLAAINDYTEGKYGQLVACVIYDSKRQPIYKVSYGYDSQARLIEERMYSHPANKLVQRVIYKYDANGNRAKPLIISLNNAGADIAPTITDDVTNAHRQLRGGNNRRRR